MLTKTFIEEQKLARDFQFFYGDDRPQDSAKQGRDGPL